VISMAVSIFVEASLIIFLHVMRLPLRSTLFPYTTLFRSMVGRVPMGEGLPREHARADLVLCDRRTIPRCQLPCDRRRLPSRRSRDRKSTRLNSSHSQISYAVFCLKKKTMILLTIA